MAYCIGNDGPPTRRQGRYDDSIDSRVVPIELREKPEDEERQQQLHCRRCGTRIARRVINTVPLCWVCKIAIRYRNQK
jgi:hypothetical protein